MAKSNLKEKEDLTVKSSDFLIKKITMKDNKAIIEYSTDDDFRTNDSKFKVKDEVTEDFKTIWQNALAIITELTPQLYKEVAALKINSISFEYNGDFLEKVSIAVVWSVDDAAVKAGLILDDNRDIIAGHDGSRVFYDKYNPRIEITITEMADYVQWKPTNEEQTKLF